MDCFSSAYSPIAIKSSFSSFSISFGNGYSIDISFETSFSPSAALSDSCKETTALLSNSSFSLLVHPHKKNNIKNATNIRFCILFSSFSNRAGNTCPIFTAYLNFWQSPASVLHTVCFIMQVPSTSRFNTSPQPLQEIVCKCISCVL